ncbi:MAG: hypothetical protein WAX04_02225, partial [Oscillospiraceae bacterium]
DDNFPVEIIYEKKQISEKNYLTEDEFQSKISNYFKANSANYIEANINIEFSVNNKSFKSKVTTVQRDGFDNVSAFSKDLDKLDLSKSQTNEILIKAAETHADYKDEMLASSVNQAKEQGLTR